MEDWEIRRAERDSVLLVMQWSREYKYDPSAHGAKELLRRPRDVGWSPVVD